MSQEELGEALRMSRFAVMKIEAGSQDLQLAHAQIIEQRTGATGLVELVERREEVAASREGAPQRDLAVRALLDREGIYRVEATLVDDLDIVDALRGSSALHDSEITIVVPSPKRERQLFGDMTPLFGHYERQLKRLSDLVVSDEAPIAVDIYESESVTSPGVVVRTRTGDACVTWPILFRRRDMEWASVPVITSQIPRVVDDVAEHVQYARERARSVHRNVALATVSGSATRDGRPAFAGYAANGNDRADEQFPSVGFATSLVILHGMVQREGFTLGRRIMLDRRRDEPRDPGRLSLVSARVDDDDIQRAIVALKAKSAEAAAKAIADMEWRSLGSADDVAVRHQDELPEDLEIPEEAFKYAAIRELRAVFGLDLSWSDIGLLEELELPPRLQSIQKANEDDKKTWHTRPILPRVFMLALRRPPQDQVTSERGSESDLHRLRQFDVSFVGYEDLRDPADLQGELNDFLVRASEDGWLQTQLQKKGMATR